MAHGSSAWPHLVQSYRIPGPASPRPCHPSSPGSTLGPVLPGTGRSLRRRRLSHPLVDGTGRGLRGRIRGRAGREPWMWNFCSAIAHGCGSVSHLSFVNASRRFPRLRFHTAPPVCRAAVCAHWERHDGEAGERGTASYMKGTGDGTNPLRRQLRLVRLHVVGYLPPALLWASCVTTSWIRVVPEAGYDGVLIPRTGDPKSAGASPPHGLCRLRRAEIRCWACAWAIRPWAKLFGTRPWGTPRLATRQDLRHHRDRRGVFRREASPRR